MYSNNELADMLIVHETVDFNSHTAWWLYQERYPNMRILHHTTFSRFNRRLRETGSLTRATMNGQETTRTLGNEKGVLPLASILGDYLNQPYLLQRSLDGRAYLIFLQQVLPELLDAVHIPSLLRHSMWYQYDGTPLHYEIHIRLHLNVAIGQKWIGCGDPMHWHVRPQDLSCVNFFWGPTKSLMYETSVSSVKESYYSNICSCRDDTWNARNLTESKEFHVVPPSSLPDDFWS
ncbi:uncharacterized protein TNCV_3122441 [Trichonephila clavipes]|nr:uncharacterized protein TNCV_3122441 [Trichonephila clavipes]